MTAMVKGRTIRTNRAREKFIDTLRDSCNISESARAAGIARSAVYEWRDADAGFAQEWADAEQEAADKLEREAWRRAVDGVDKPISYQGEITATYKEYSDRMLEILLKAHRPDKFTDRSKLTLDMTDDAAKLLSEARQAAKRE